MTSYALSGEVRCTERVARWRPLCNWALVAPSAVWSAVLGFGAAAVVVVSWGAIVFTGRLPESLGDYLVGVLRYQWRVNMYLYGFTDAHPGFRVVAGYRDPGGSPAVLSVPRPTSRRRATVAFRAVLALPLLVVLYLARLVAIVVLATGWFAVLIMGRWPRPLRTFVIGWLRWTFRVSAYLCLLVDDYPPFSGRSSERATPDDGTPGEGVPVDGGAPPRLIRWPVVVGAALFVVWVALVAVRVGTASNGSTPPPPYSLSAPDAGFSAIFPGRPQRTERMQGATRIIAYVSTTSDEVVAVTSFGMQPTSTFDLDRAITGFAAAEPGWKVVGRSPSTYLGQPAEDGSVSFPGGVGEVRVVVLGTSAYALEGFGPTSSSFAGDYQELLDSFRAN